MHWISAGLSCAAVSSAVFTLNWLVYFKDVAGRKRAPKPGGERHTKCQEGRATEKMLITFVAINIISLIRSIR